MASSTSFAVLVTRPGPLLLRLRLDVSMKFAVVHGFDRAEDGSKGELEVDGRIEENDVLESINGISLEGRMLEDILLQISRVSRESSTKALRFRKHKGSLAVVSVADVTERAILSPSRISTEDIQVMYTEGTSKVDNGNGTASGTSEKAEDPHDPFSSSSQTNHCTDAIQHVQKAQAFRSLFKETLINEGRLRNQASQGIPDKQGLRAVIWRLLLKYLPLEADLWMQHLADQRAEYASATERLIQSTPYNTYFPSGSNTTQSSAVGIQKLGVLIKVDDDPLRISDASAWATYFSDTTLMDEIQKDVVRTHPDINFFNSDPQGAHQSVMQRILFIYAKLHPNVRYVQGMNELCGTLYYVFASDEDEDFARHAEADTYHCFCLLVDEMQDVFIRQKDSSDSGIIARIKEFTDLLLGHDPELHGLLEIQGIDAAFYGFRWLTTMLSREFNLPDTIRLWDTLFSDTNRNEFLSYICCTMILEQRDKLMAGDFAENLGLLQSYPETDVNALLSKATRLRSKDFARRARFLSGAGEDSFSTEDAESPAVNGETPLRFLVSLKTAAGVAAGAAGSSLSDMKSSVGLRLQGVRAMITEGNNLLRASKDSFGERVGSSLRSYFTVSKSGDKGEEHLTPF